MFLCYVSTWYTKVAFIHSHIHAGRVRTWTRSALSMRIDDVSPGPMMVGDQTTHIHMWLFLQPCAFTDRRPHVYIMHPYTQTHAQVHTHTYVTYARSIIGCSGLTAWAVWIKLALQVMADCCQFDTDMTIAVNVPLPLAVKLVYVITYYIRIFKATISLSLSLRHSLSTPSPDSCILTPTYLTRIIAHIFA